MADIPALNSMKNIVIVGAGGFGREVFNYAKDSIRKNKIWKIKGFIDDNLNALQGYDYPSKIIGKISEYNPVKGDIFLMALGNPKAKKNVSNILISKGAIFKNLIHPTATIGRNVKMGSGCIICPKAILTCDIDLGDFVTINCSSACGHDSKIGNYSTLSSYCDVTGFCSLGEGVFFSSHVSMRPSSKVGDWASVGIGSSVIMNIKAGTSVHGNPAVKIQ